MFGKKQQSTQMKMARKSESNSTTTNNVRKTAKVKRKLIITSVAKEVMGKRIQGKRSKYGQFKEILMDAQDVYVWLTRDQVKNEIRRLEKINKTEVNNLDSAVAGLLSL